MLNLKASKLQRFFAGFKLKQRNVCSRETLVSLLKRMFFDDFFVGGRNV